MSRQLVMQTINKLSNLLDEESGISHEMVGSGRKKMGGMGGAQVPYGSGLVAAPAPFGRGGAVVAGGKLTKREREQIAAENPWIAYVRGWANYHGLSYHDALAYHGGEVSQDYHNNKAYAQQLVASGRSKPKKKAAKRGGARIYG